MDWQNINSVFQQLGLVAGSAQNWSGTGTTSHCLPSRAQIHPWQGLALSSWNNYRIESWNH